MSNNDNANRKELDQQIGRVGKQLAQEKDQKRRQNLRDQGRNLVRRRSYHVDDNEIVSYANRKEEVFDDLMNVFLDDEWKPFPKDKVNRQIDRKKEDKETNNARQIADSQAKNMRAVSNYRTKMTDPHDANQKFVGNDRKKNIDRIIKHDDERAEALRKMEKQVTKQKKASSEGDREKAQKHYNKAVKHHKKSENARQRGNAMKAVKKSYERSKREDEEKQAEVNRKSKEDRRKAKRMLDATNLEKAYEKPAAKGATKGGFKKEAMNYTNWLDSCTDPLYEVKGALPKCPPGYKYSPQQKQCVPKTDKDDVRKDKGGSKDSNPSNGPGYNVWGRTGVNGDGYAWAEPNNWDTDAYDGPSGGMYN